MKIQNSFKNSFQKGSLMVEVLIVVSVITVSIIVALSVAQKSIYLARQSLSQAKVAFLLEEGAEAARIVRDNNWSNISSLTLGTDYYLVFSGGTWTLSVAPSTVGIFTRKVVFSPAYRDVNQNLASSGTPDSQTVLVTVSVSWIDSGKNLSKTIQFYLTDLFS